MNEKIKIHGEKEIGYKAKEAMKLAIQRMREETAQVISIFAVEEKKWDSECVLFVKLFLSFLHKNRGRVLLFAENDTQLSKLEEYIVESNAKIRIVERITMEEHGVSYDMILNRINGAEAECIIASLPVEIENQFLEKKRTALDAKIWFSIGTHLKQKQKPSKMQSVLEKISQLFTKKEV